MSFFLSNGKRTSLVISCKIPNCPLLTVFPHLRSTFHRSHGLSQLSCNRNVFSLNALHTYFVKALIVAGQCNKYLLKHTLRTSIVARSRACSLPSFDRRRHFTAHRARDKWTKTSPPSTELSTKEELIALVDQYNNYSFTDHLPLVEPPNLRQPEEGPHIVVSDEAEDRHWPSYRYKWPARGEELKAVEQLEEALRSTRFCPDELYRLYRALPAPRIPYLDANVRHRLLHNLGVLERRDEEGMLRYLSVIDDMKAAGIPLTTPEWNRATSFAGRYVGKTTEAEIESGLRSWKEMEHVAGVRGNSATFNILFDMATKAGKFTLAEKIYEEMGKRGHSFNRFHHVSLIYYYGLRADGDGVRKAYRELIDAGEIVDTVVLNCVISALFRAFEPEAAEHVYERMKRLHGERIGAELPSKDFRKRREVTKALIKMAEHARRDPRQLSRFQNSSVIAPDAQTYRILVQNLAINAGELHKAVKYLDEMHWFEVPLDGSIFLALFNGFALHGGVRYTYWTEDRLESVWKAYLQAIDNQHEGLYIGKWMIIWALKAFAKCSNRDRTLEVWESVKDKWKSQDEELQIVTKLLRSLVEP